MVVRGLEKYCCCEMSLRVGSNTLRSDLSLLVVPARVTLSKPHIAAHLGRFPRKTYLNDDIVSHQVFVVFAVQDEMPHTPLVAAATLSARGTTSSAQGTQ